MRAIGVEIDVLFLFILFPYVPLRPTYTNIRLLYPNTLVYPGVFWSLHVIICNLLWKLYEKEMVFLLRE